MCNFAFANLCHYITMKKAIIYSLCVSFAVAMLLTSVSCGKDGLEYNLDGSRWSGVQAMNGQSPHVSEDGTLTYINHVDSVVMHAAFEGGQCRVYGYAVVYKRTEPTGELKLAYQRPFDCVGPYSYKEGAGTIATGTESYAAKLSFTCDEGSSVTVKFPTGYLFPKELVQLVNVTLQQETAMEW